MANSKDILVTTTSSIEGVTIKQYLKPISSHIVAGTNLFSDFFASLSDVFGGRSKTYQRQLTSLYNEAIERLKIAAYEVGANCIIGLSIDMDEISGKGKSMFMLTAVGTAVSIDIPANKKNNIDFNEKFENIDIERIKILQKKNAIIRKANDGTLALSEESWDFITENQVIEIFDFILSKLRECLSGLAQIDNPFEKLYNKAIAYINALPEYSKVQLVGNSILKEDNERLAIELCGIARELELLDFDIANKILQAKEFKRQKLGLRFLISDKHFYSRNDIREISSIVTLVKDKFPERGIRSMKKQLLSSKEKEIWTCECKGTNDIGTRCGCGQDIYGFQQGEVTPTKIIIDLEEKIHLITEHTK